MEYLVEFFYTFAFLNFSTFLVLFLSQSLLRKNSGADDHCTSARWFSCGATTIDGAVVSLTGDETAAEEEEKEEVQEEEEERRGGISLRRGGDPITTGATTGSVAMSGEATGILGWSGTASMAEGGAERV